MPKIIILDILSGKDHGLEFEEFIGAELRNKALMWIDDDDALWVQVPLNHVDHDSTDTNDFRVYCNAEYSLNGMIRLLKEIPDQVTHGFSPANLDRLLVKSYGFTRHI